MGTIGMLVDYGFRRGYQSGGNAVAGLLEGYPISMVGQNQGVGLQIAITVPMEETQAQRVKEILSEEKELRKRMPVSIEEGCIVLRGNMPQKKMEETLDWAQELLSAALRQVGAPIPTLCPICGEGNCDVYAQVADSFRPTHRRCVQETVQTAAEKAEQNLVKGNYFTGILGACIGALVGGIPNVLTILFMSRAYSMLYALIPVCAYKGYELFGGKRDKSTRWITIAVSVVGSVLVDFISFYISLLNEWGYNSRSFQLISIVLKEKEVQSALTQDIFSSLAFVALGIYLTWQFIGRNAQSELEAATATVDTMIPIQAALPQREEIRG